MPAQAGFVTHQIKSHAKAVATKLKTGGAHGHPEPTFKNPAAGYEEGSSESASAIPAELEAIAQCESGGDYRAVNSSSGAGGKYQFLPSTWASVGGTGLPQDASPAEQDKRALILWDGGAGRSHWVC